jgi:MoaA/NifB/PqqE/SkfB family radical SAM enzyme
MYRYIGLHGWGEPLLNPRIFDMVSYAEAIGLETNLTTNGTLVGGRVAEIIDSGLRQIAFGVYDQKLFNNIVPAIKELIEERERQSRKTPRIYLDLTIYQRSLHHISDSIELAGDIGLDAVIVHRLFNAWRIEPAVKYITPDEEVRLFSEIREVAGSSGLPVYLPPRHSYPCRVVRYSIFIAVDGSVTPCCFLPEYCLGNVLETDLADILATECHRRFVAKMAVGTVCGRCAW